MRRKVLTLAMTAAAAGVGGTILTWPMAGERELRGDDMWVKVDEGLNAAETQPVAQDMERTTVELGRFAAAFSFLGDDGAPLDLAVTRAFNDIDPTTMCTHVQEQYSLRGEPKQNVYTDVLFNSFDNRRHATITIMNPYDAPGAITNFEDVFGMKRTEPFLGNGTYVSSVEGRDMSGNITDAYSLRSDNHSGVDNVAGFRRNGTKAEFISLLIAGGKVENEQYGSKTPVIVMMSALACDVG